MEVRIVFAGSPQVAVPTLQALLDAAQNVVGVVTRPPARRGRRGSPEPTPVAVAAQAAGIPVLETTRPAGEAELEQIASWRPDLGVVVAYGAILRPTVLALPQHGWINLHFSKLPRWRGAAPVQWAIREGDPETATTVFQLEQGLDTGPVFTSAKYLLQGDETSGQLLERLAPLGAKQVLEVVESIRNGSAVAAPQDERGVTVAPQLSKQDGYVNFDLSAAQTDRIIRSVTPNPGAWTRLPNGKILKLGPVLPVEGVDAAPGSLVATKSDVLVGCEKGSVRLGKVAPEGKSWMDASAWVRGARWQDDMRLGDAE